MTGVQTVVLEEITPNEMEEENGWGWLLKNVDNAIEHIFDGRSIFYTATHCDLENIPSKIELLPLSDETILQLRRRHSEFRDGMDALLDEHELLMLPAAPVDKLEAGANHSQTRQRLLRYTAPVSLAGMPAVTIPFSAHGKPAGGMQLVAAREDDARLLAISASLGSQRKSAS